MTEIQKKIIALRRQDKTFAEIAPLVGMKNKQAVQWHVKKIKGLCSKCFQTLKPKNKI